MKSRYFKCQKGFSLIETVIVMCIVLIAILGTSAYRYCSSSDMQKATVALTGARVGALLCESWHGAGGGTSYNPVSSLGANLTISASAIPAYTPPEGSTTLGTYKIVLNGANYYAAMFYKNVDSSLQALNVVVAWEPSGVNATWVTNLTELKLFKLTTYVGL